MKLISNWSRGKLYWRTFTKDDTVYITGLRDGFLSNGEVANINHPTGFFQMEIKRGDIFGSNLVTAGHVFNNDDEFILTDDGMLTDIADAAHITIDAGGFKFEPYGRVVQFLSSGSADSAIKLVSSLTQVTTSTNTKQTTLNNSAINEKEGKIAGEVSANGKQGALDLGLKVNPSLSEKVVNKIERVVVSTFSIQISTTTSYSEEQNITLKAGKLTVIIISWQRRFVTGTVILGRDTFPYEATLGYFSSRQISEYASADELPAELMAEYSQQNSGYLPPNQQSDWRWCHKCQGLFFAAGQQHTGSCPAGGQHEKSISGNYTLVHSSPNFNGQHDWRWCYKCYGLFFSAGQAQAGRCPAGGQHDKTKSGNYALAHNAPKFNGQHDWRWCHKCYGLFFASAQGHVGLCPAGGQHEKGVSGNYALGHTPSS